MYAKTTAIQISLLSGFMKEKTPGRCLAGFLIMMEMPSDMNGFVKSVTASRWELMVSGAMATSASLRTSSPIIPFQPPGESLSTLPYLPSFTVL